MTAQGHFDVAVVGGGPAGVAAALGAARAGARTLLLERESSLGGNVAQALVHTLCGLYLSPALALARYRGPGKGILETLLALPLVLPPTAVGLVLLETLGRSSPLGGWLASHGFTLVFTWKAVVLAMAVMSFPLLVRSARTAFEEVDPRLVGLSRTLVSYGRVAAFLRVTLPLAWRGLLAGVVLAFSRALGECGAPVMVAGNIPGKTQTLSLAIFHNNQLGRDDRALVLAGVKFFRNTLGGINDTGRIPTPNQRVPRYAGRPVGREVFRTDGGPDEKDP